MTSGKTFVGVQSGLTLTIYKLVALATGRWDVYFWSPGWRLVDNISLESAIEYMDKCDEVFFERNSD